MRTVEDSLQNTSNRNQENCMANILYDNNRENAIESDYNCMDLNYNFLIFLHDLHRSFLLYTN